MRSQTLNAFRVFAFTALITTFAPHNFAGGPIGLCASGTPFLWPNGGLNIPFNPDQGDLGPVGHLAAVQLVADSFAVWQSVPTAAATYMNAGELPEDVDVNNFFPYLFPSAPDGLSAIVFDHTGEIFDLLFGAGSGILGFAGPEWIDVNTCSIIEGVSFLNGPSFSNGIAAFDVMVHEFGHYTGLAHTVVNGQTLIGDTSGPTPNNTFGSPPVTSVETMYPFYFGPGTDMSSLEKDDIASVSALYPAPGFSSGSGTISGRILAGNGVTPLTGVNVIARNIANPLQDAVSAISGDYAIPLASGDPFEGIYKLRGLTPGAQYAVYIDSIFAGGFSTPLLPNLPGPEEFYNGPRESNNGGTVPDDPADYTPVNSVAGSETANINIILNRFKPGENLPVGDDGNVELPLPFPFTIGGATFNSLFVNANGSLTFGSPDNSYIPALASFLQGVPRIAGLWSDINPAAGGRVYFAQTASTFSVQWEKVPQWPNIGSNTFKITLSKSSDQVDIQFGTVDIPFGLVGLSSGGAVNTGTEVATDLSASIPRRIGLERQPAIFESFSGNPPFDLANKTVRFTGTHDYNDNWAGPNHVLKKARSISLPFNSSDVTRYTEIEPAGGDVDFFRFHLNKNDTLVARTVAGGLDSYLGLFSVQNSTFILVAADDDSGPGTLSTLVYRAPTAGDYVLGVTTFPDADFTGDGFSGGRYVLDLKAFGPDPNNLLVNGGFEFGGTLGWTAFETGSPFIPWLVSSAGDGAGFNMAPTQPQEGAFVAWNGFDGSGPMQFVLYQDVTIPASASAATLEWADRFQWNFLVGTQTLPRKGFAEVRNPITDAVLAVFESFDSGINFGLGDSGWQTHSADLSPFIGQTVRIQFTQEIPEPFTGPGQFEIDAIRLRPN